MTTPKPPNIIDLTKDDKYMDKIGVPISNDNFLNMEKPPQDLKEEKDTRGNQGNIVEETQTHEKKFIGLVDGHGKYHNDISINEIHNPKDPEDILDSHNPQQTHPTSEDNNIKDVNDKTF